MIWTNRSFIAFAITHGGPKFSFGHCDKRQRQISNPRVPNELYGPCLTKETFRFIVGELVCFYRLLIYCMFHPALTANFETVFKMISFENI